MDKIQALKAILEQDPNNNFARYGLGVELANRGETDAALAEFDALLAKEPGYTAGYSQAAQTLAAAGRIPEAIERFKAGIRCATESGNHHAASQMQLLLDELDR
jgi:predicted Zn-dependent protease